MVTLKISVRSSLPFTDLCPSPISENTSRYVGLICISDRLLLKCGFWVLTWLLIQSAPKVPLGGIKSTPVAPAVPWEREVESMAAGFNTVQLVVAVIWDWDQWMEDLLLSHCQSAFQINKQKYYQTQCVCQLIIT